MPQQTPESFLQDYFAKNPTHTVEQAVKAFDAARAVEPQDDYAPLKRLGDAVVPTALRVGGSIAGGVVGSAAGPAGTAFGGAVGSGLGETAAEAYETWRGKREGLNPVQIAFQSALGAVPLGKAGTLLPKQVIAREALKGSALGATATAGTEMAEGRTPKVLDVAEGALLGAGLGAAGGKLAAKARPIPQVDTAIPKLSQLELERELAAKAAKAPKGSGLRDRVTRPIRRKLIDQFADVADFVKEGEAAAGINLRPEHDPRVINDLVYGGTGGRVENALGDFRSIREDAQRMGLGPALERYLDLQFMKHGADTLQEHAGEAARRGDMIGALDIHQKLNRGESLPQGYNPSGVINDLNDLTNQLGGANSAGVQQLAKRVFDQNRKALDIAHDAGLVGDEVYQKLIARPDNYGPLTRILDTVADDAFATHASTLDLQKQQVLFNLRGSQKNTQNPIEASMRRMQETIKEAGRNEAARTFVQLRDVHPTFAAQIQELPQGATAPKGSGTISFYDQGAKRTFAVPEDISNAMRLANAHDMQLVGKTILSFSRNMLQKFATGANLAFSIPNVIRDVQDARKLSTAYKPYNPIDFAKFVGEYTTSLKQALMKDPEYREFLESRAGFSTLQKNINPKQFLEERKGSMNPLAAIAKVNSLLEEGTKLTTFKRLKGAGKSDVQAAIETRRFGGSPDFGRRGNMSTEANLLFMFFNASVQGIVRNGKRLNPITNPARAATLLGGASLTAMALDRWNSQFQDPDGTPSMERVSDKDRQNYFIFMRPETYKTSEGVVRHRYVKLPKGHVAKLIMNPLQEALSPSQSAGQTVANVASGLSPVNVDLDTERPISSVASGLVASTNPAIRAPLEQVIGAGGMDTFRGMPIVPRRLQNVEPNEQFDKTTSPSIRRATQALNDVLGPEFGRLSPKRIEALLRTGPLVGPGDMALNTLDDVIEPTETRGLEGDEAVGKVPLVGTIARRFVGSAVDQQEADTFESFYQLRTQTEEVSRTLAALSKSDPAKAKAYAEENKVLIGAGPAIRKLAEGFAALRQAKAAQPERAQELGAAERALLFQAQQVQKLLSQLER